MVQQRLLDIAVEAFGRNGLDGASTREIAKAAGTAMSSITYHYGGKEGLYLAAADHVAQRMGDQVGRESIDAAIASGDPVVARAEIHRIISRLLVRLLDRKSDGWAMFVMREQMVPTAAFERIFAGPMGYTSRAVVTLVGIVTGIRDCEAVRLAAISIIGQVLILKSARGTCSKVLERDAFSPDVIQAYERRVCANADAILDRMIAERQEQA